MSQALNRPSFTADIAGIDRRVGALERRTTPAAAKPDTSIMFSYAGPLATTVSPPTRVRAGGVLTDLAVTLGTAGSTDTLLVVGRNGTDAAVITVPAGYTTFDGPVGVRYGASDILVVAIASAGTGAADMTAEARFS